MNHDSIMHHSLSNRALDFVTLVNYECEMSFEESLAVSGLSFEDLLVDWHHAGRDKRLSVVGYITQELHTRQELYYLDEQSEYVHPWMEFTYWWFESLRLHKARVRSML